MATYLELARITEETGWGDFFDKVVTATAIKATAIIDSVAPSAVALDWAKIAIDAPRAEANNLVWYVIASNDTATLSVILSATDSAIQTNVDAAVDALYP